MFALTFWFVLILAIGQGLSGTKSSQNYCLRNCGCDDNPSNDKSQRRILQKRDDDDDDDEDEKKYGQTQKRRLTFFDLEQLGNDNTILAYCAAIANSGVATVNNYDRESTTWNYREVIQAFSQSMLTEISLDHQHNLVFSPLSIHAAISTLVFGSKAESSTRNELLRGLGFIGSDQSNSLAYLERHYLDIFENYNKRNFKVVTTANRIWTSKSTKGRIEKKYISGIEKIFGTDLAQFSGKSLQKNVNDWVSQKTKGKITKIVEYIDSSTSMLLTNAIHFKDSWTSSFIMTETPLEFTTSDGSKVMTEMMESTSYDMVSTQFTFESILPAIKMSMVTMRYSSDNGRFQIIVVMPEVYTGLQQLMDHLAHNQGSEQIFETIHKVAQKASLVRGQQIVTMPVFNIKSDLNMKEYLRKLGVQSAFTQAAEFVQISRRIPLHVTAISHSASVEVTTGGTTGAAAANIAGVSLPKIISINKPFLFIIKDTLFETILFVGKITDPTQQY